MVKKNPLSKLKEWQVLEIIERIKNKEKLIDISKKYNISCKVISDIKLNRRWKYIKRESEKKYTGKKVYKFDLEGNLLQQWESVKECIDEIKCNNSVISQCLSGKIKTHKGFIYQDNLNFNPIIYKKRKNNHKIKIEKIICLNDNKKFFHIKEMSKFYNISVYFINLNLKKGIKNKKNLNFKYL